MINNLPMVADTAATSANQPGTGNMWFMVAFYVLIFAVAYFFLFRPNSKKKKEEAEMRSKIEIGDEITTIGGIVGRIVAKKDDEDAFIIETGPDRVKMKFKTWCISTVDTAKEKTASTPEVEKKGFFGKKKTEDETK